MSRLFAGRPTRRPSPRTTSSADPTRTLILEQAARMFRCFGYENTSLAMIAEAINLTAPAIYRHFPSKYELFVVSVTQLQIGFDQRMEEVSHKEDTTAADKIRALTMAHALHQLQRAIPEGQGSNRVFTIGQLTEHLQEPEKSTLNGLQRKHMERVRDIVREGIASGEFDVDNATVAAFSIIALPEHLVLWYKPDGPMSETEVAEMLADLAIRMLTVR